MGNNSITVTYENVNDYKGGYIWIFSHTHTTDLIDFFPKLHWLL